MMSAGAARPSLVLVAVIAAGCGRDAPAPPRPPSAPIDAAGAAAPARPSRRVVAVLGFENRGQPSEAWIGQALTELLALQLAASDDLRVLPGATVARVRVELGLRPAVEHDAATLARVRGNARADLVVSGSYLVQAGTIAVDVRVADTAAGRSLGLTQDSAPEAKLVELGSRVAASLRQQVGARVPDAAVEASARMALPTHPDAARLHAEGVLRLRALDAAAARELLERAVAKEPGHALTRLRLAQALLVLGYDSKAAEAVRAAVERAQGLPQEERLLVEATLARASHDFGRAASLLRALWQGTPDDVDAGLELAAAQVAAGERTRALETIAALRRLPAPASEDPRIDLGEAAAHAALANHAEAREAAARAVARGRTEGASLVVAEARLYEGTAARLLGDVGGAQAAFDEARRLFGAAGDDGGTADALRGLATVAAMQARHDEAERLGREALRLHRRIGHKVGEANDINNLSFVLDAEDRWDESVQMNRRALEIAREVDDLTGIGLYAANVAETAMYDGDLAGAGRLAQEAVGLADRIGDRRIGSWARTVLSQTRLLAGDLAGAAKLAQESLALANRTGERSLIADPLHVQGELARLGGDLATARLRHDEALSHAVASGDRPYVARGRLYLAELTLDEGKAREAEQQARAILDEFDADLFLAHRVATLNLLARALLAQPGRALEADETLDLGGQRLRFARAHIGHQVLRTTRGRLLVALGRQVEARRRLQGVVDETARAGVVLYALEARVALGEAEVSAGVARGAARLAEAATEATSRGLTALAARARAK